MPATAAIRSIKRPADGTPDHHEERMWVRVPDWMVLEGDVPEPRAGAALKRAGVRVLGRTLFTEPGELDGVTELLLDETHPSRATYRVTGVATDVRAVEVDFGGGARHAGSEFVLTSGIMRLQVQVERPVAIAPGARVTVEGPMVVVGDYEWDGFDLTDTRADWRVRSVVLQTDGDLMLDLDG